VVVVVPDDPWSSWLGLSFSIPGEAPVGPGGNGFWSIAMLLTTPLSATPPAEAAVVPVLLVVDDDIEEEDDEDIDEEDIGDGMGEAIGAGAWA
jgi:hypothetical protein